MFLKATCVSGGEGRRERRKGGKERREREEEKRGERIRLVEKILGAMYR